MVKIVIPPEAFVVNHLFEDSKFFLEEAKKLQDQHPHTMRRYIRASIITAFAAVEALLNTMLFVLEEDEDLELVERAFIQEKRVELTEDGYFDIKGQQFRSLEQKIAFLHWRLKGVRFPKGDVVWTAFGEATKLRNEIVHPKPSQVSYSKLTISAAESCLSATVKIAQKLGWTEQ
jgi:hypothetical protein